MAVLRLLFNVGYKNAGRYGAFWGVRKSGTIAIYHNICYYYDRYFKEVAHAGNTQNSPCFRSKK